MFQFPRFPLRHKDGVLRLFIEAGSPIRKSPAELARQLTEAYRSLAASFIGFQRLGIHHAPVVALTTNPLPPQYGFGSLRSLSIRLLTCAPAGLPPGFPAEEDFGRRVHRKTATREDAGPVPADLSGSPDLFSAPSTACQDTRQPHLTAFDLSWWSRRDSPGRAGVRPSP